MLAFVYEGLSIPLVGDIFTLLADWGSCWGGVGSASLFWGKGRYLYIKYVMCSKCLPRGGFIVFLLSLLLHKQIVKYSLSSRAFNFGNGNTSRYY